MRVLEHALQLRPTLPPKATHFALRGIEYMGASVSLALKSNGTVMEVRTGPGGPTGSIKRVREPRNMADIWAAE